MPRRPVWAGIPIRSFGDAWRRLDADLEPEQRRRLVEATAERLVDVLRQADLRVVVITPDPDVTAWATERGCDVLAEPPEGGLDAAATAFTSVAMEGDAAWLVVHGDLPLLTSDDAAAAAEAAATTGVAAPSLDGGTNLVGAATPLSFSYGQGSFARHLSAFAPRRPTVLCTAGTAIDIDRIDHAAAAASLAGGAWLTRFLG